MFSSLTTSPVNAALPHRPPPPKGAGRLSLGIEVVVTHADPLVREGLLAVLSRQDDFVVNASTLTDDGLPMEAAWRAPARVVVTDCSSAIELLRRAALEAAPQGTTSMLIVAPELGTGGVASALRLGARGCILVNAPVAELVEGVRALAGGSRYFCAAVSAMQWQAVNADKLNPLHAARTAPAEPNSERNQARGGLAPGARRRVLAHIEAHFAEKIELCDLAALAGLSECHFSRAFKQSLGVPPHRYLMRRRVAAAAALIEQTDRPLSDISLEVGFADQSHFTRVFVELTDETPRAYRRRHR
jgi:AraC-like DNA-binding protein